MVGYQIAVVEEPTHGGVTVIDVTPGVDHVEQVLQRQILLPNTASLSQQYHVFFPSSISENVVSRIYSIHSVFRWPNIGSIQLFSHSTIGFQLMTFFAHISNDLNEILVSC